MPTNISLQPLIAAAALLAAFAVAWRVARGIVIHRRLDLIERVRANNPSRNLLQMRAIGGALEAADQGRQQWLKAVQGMRDAGLVVTE